MKMLERNPSLSRQLLVSYFFVVMILIIAIIISLGYLEQVQQARKVVGKILELRYDIQNNFETELKFLLSSPTDYEYHATKKSFFLQSHDTIYKKITENLLEIEKTNTVINDSLRKGFENIKEHLIDHELIFNEVVQLIYRRGLKDYGLEGKMRTYIHALDSLPLSKRTVTVEEVLTLRRHEKDFLLRHDSLYIKNLNKLVVNITNRLTKDPQKNRFEITLLDNYKNAFNELAQVIFLLGNYQNGGLKRRLSNSSQSIERELNLQTELIRNREKKFIEIAYQFFYLTIVLGVLTSIILGFWLAKRRTSHLRALSKKIQKITSSEDFSNLQINLAKAPVEVVNLANSFQMLLNKLNLQLELVEEKKKTLEDQNHQLQKINQELDQFVYRVSHDLRAPLASVLGLVHIAKDEENIVKLREYMDLQEKTILRLDSFIKDIIDLSRNTRLELEVSTIDWQMLIENIFEQLSYIENTTRVEKRVRIVCPQLFFSDYRRLEVIMSNLVSNALRYSNPGADTPYLAVEVTCHPHKAIIEVKDNGQGIGKEHLDKIFQMFYRASKDSKGSGIGLYIVKETVEKLQGKISVESEVGVGTRFIIEVPNLHNNPHLPENEETPVGNDQNNGAATC